jgi:hypothetical protein
VLRSAFSEDESFIEIDLVNKLQSIVEKQRDQIRTLDTSLADIKSELDEVTAPCAHLAVLGIRIRRISMFLGLPDPVPLVRGADPDPDPSLFSEMC